MCTWVIQFDEAIHLTDLGRFIDCFDVDANAEGIGGTLGVISVQVGHSLFHARAAPPMINELPKLLKLPERDVVDMSESLGLKDDRLRDAALAATLRIRRMEPTVIVDCVPLLLREGAILAFLVAGVSLRTLLACSCNEAVKGLVFAILNQSFLFVHTVGALHVGGVSAAELCRPRC